MTTLLAPPAVSFPTKGPMGWSETSTADTSSKSSISAPTATPTHAPMASTAEDTMTAESQGIPMQTASTQTDNEVLSRATSHAANRANDRNYLQGQAEKPGQESDLDSSPLKPKQGAASHYLRRAEAHELPSFGNVGLANPEAAGAAAASLAHASAKPVEIWKPDPISAAGAAACLAHASPKRVEPWKPTQGTGAGKAARHALEDNNDRITPLTEPQPPERWSLTGTQGSMKVCRAGPSSTLQHDSGTEISGNALTTAPPAHMPMVRRASNAVEPAFEQPVENDLNNAGGVSQQERRKSDILRAATISMVKRNCDTHSPDSPRHRVPSPGRQRPAAPPSSRHQIYGPDLDEAACKVAAARLALIGYDPKRSASLLEAKGAQASLSRSRSVIAEDASDHSVAQRTDGNPSRSHDNLARLENKKRGENAVLLMAAAQRNVQAQMSGLDRQIADSKGLVRREDWEARARELAQASHDKRQHQNQDAIAARNVRPVLDEMTRKAEAERARVSAEKTRAAEERMELEEKKRLQEVWREREKETQEELRRAQAMGKEEGKCRKGQEKRHQKERRHSFRTESKRAKGSNSNNNIQPLQLLAPIVSNSNSNSDDHAPITPPTSPKEEKGLRGLINKFRVRRLSRNARRTSSKEPSSVGATAITKNYPSTNCNTAPSRDPNIPPPSALQTNGSQTPTTTPTLTEVALLGAPPPAPTARLPRNPPHTSSPVSSLHSFQCRGETVLEVHISDDDGSGDAAHNGYSNSSNNPQRRKGEDTRNHSNGAEEHNTFPGTPPALAALNLSGEQLPLEREASAGEPGNRSSIGSKFFENL
ncbi:unnamed protein product [Tuber melanosporum]|uniref:(Perigord truffle) hypothetical protein n=1 Tax=Tuber melanosporum (strain Mel28) TaxID=656061 RepID=D5GPP6_TUBMM|nr:uncharacterized protein GSTUM_00011962001 [Tuber melanosporum]CAZ86489.1 unnamed protein product [Tuber melanosporum]